MRTVVLAMVLAVPGQALAQSGQPAEIGTGRVGQRLTRADNAATLATEPMARVDSRIATRVQSRLATRIDRNQVAPAGATAAIDSAGDRARRVTPQR